MSNKLLTLAFNCSRFRGTARLVLLSLADRISEETWSCFCDYEDLMRRCHCARSVLAEALAELDKSGLLVKQRRFSAATVYGLNETLLREWQYPKPTRKAPVKQPPKSSESKFPPQSFGNRTNTDSEKFGSPNANPHNSPPSGAHRGAGTESLRFGGSVKRSEAGGSPIANAGADDPASQDTDNPNTTPQTSGATPPNPQQPDQRQGTASPRDPALTGNPLKSDGSGFSQPVPQSAPTARTPSPVPPPPLFDFPDLNTEPARYLANELWMFLSGRPEVEIPFDWERLWTKDFDAPLRQGYSYDDIWLAIRASQTGVARPMYVRALSIVNQLDRLIDNGQKLEKYGLLDVHPCPYCKTNLTDLHHVDHVFNCPDQPEINRADALEEQLMDISEEMHGEGFGLYAEDASMFYPEREDATEGCEVFYPQPDDATFPGEKKP